jgi:hypothetical protein
MEELERHFVCFRDALAHSLRQHTGRWLLRLLLGLVVRGDDEVYCRLRIRV